MASKSPQIHQTLHSSQERTNFTKKKFGYGDVFTLQYLESKGGYQETVVEVSGLSIWIKSVAQLVIFGLLRKCHPSKARTEGQLWHGSKEGGRRLVWFCLPICRHI